MLRKFRFGFLVASLVLIFGISSAFAIPMVVGDYNGIFFRNSEVLVDEDNDNEVDVGEIFWGVANVNEIVAPTDSAGQTGPQTWPLGGSVPPPEVTGYFIYEVTGAWDPLEAGNPTPGLPYMEFGPTNTDPNNIFTTAELAAGATIKFFEDTIINFDDTTQGSALATATDGNNFWTLGFGPNWDSSSTGGYWYAYAPKVVPVLGPIGEGYAGLNFLKPTQPPQLFALVNDPNESVEDLDVELWLNSELFRLEGNQGLTIGDNDSMHFGSNDPGVFKPVPEPASMLLLGSGLISLAAFGRKKFFKKG